MQEQKATPELVKVIKQTLNVTWEDGETDAKIEEIANDGIAYLNTRAGQNLNYEASGEPRRLLKAYARYAYSGAESDFKADYAGDLAALHFDSQIKERGYHKNEE